MKENKQGNTGLIIAIVILLLVCVGMGTFIAFDTDKTSKENTKTTEKNEVAETNKKCQNVSYDLKTSGYGLSATGGGISISTDKSRKSVRISYNGATISNTFGLGWVTGADTGIYELIDTKTFDKKISQILIDGSGQSASTLAVLYLMEDGTVEYVPILKDITTNWGQADNTKKFNSYGKLDEIKDIISLIPADGDGYHTVLARKADGTVTDLSNIFQKTGNFS